MSEDRIMLVHTAGLHALAEGWRKLADEREAIARKEPEMGVPYGFERGVASALRTCAVALEGQIAPVVVRDMLAASVGDHAMSESRRTP